MYEIPVFALGVSHHSWRTGLYQVSPPMLILYLHTYILHLYMRYIIYVTFYMLVYVWVFMYISIYTCLIILTKRLYKHSSRYLACPLQSSAVLFLTSIANLGGFGSIRIYTVRIYTYIHVYSMYLYIHKGIQ